jgi:hypothetical protein
LDTVGFGKWDNSEYVDVGMGVWVRGMYIACLVT